MLQMLKNCTILLDRSELLSVFLILALIMFGTLMETVGVGLVVPTVALLSQQNIVEQYPVFAPVLALLGNPSQERLIVYTMITLLVVFLAKNLCMVVITWRQMKFAFDVQARLSLQMLKLYLTKPYAFHLQRNSSELIYNVGNGVSTYVTSALIPGMFLLIDLMVVIGLFSLLLYFEPFGAIASILVVGSSGILFNTATKSKVVAWGRERRLHETARLQHMQQALASAKDVKLMGREEDFLSLYNYHNLESARVNKHYTAMQYIPRLWLEFLAVFGLALLVITMVALNKGMENIVPTLALFAASIFRLMPSVNRMLQSIQQIRFTAPIIDNLAKELSTVTEETAPSCQQRLNFAHFNLRDLNFTYESSQSPTLHEVDLSFNRGQAIGIIGKTGSGKSTLLDLILGLLAPSSGTITIDDKPLTKCLRQWQNEIGYVPQSIYLTDDSIRRNIAFGIADVNIDETKVINALKSSKLHDFVMSLPDGLDTVVGERGVRLSGGQCQRIGIARALYNEPTVLVLDEATSSLDLETERAIISEIEECKGEKTLIIVAHRLTTVAHCDLVIELAQGRVIRKMSGREAQQVPAATSQAATI